MREREPVLDKKKKKKKKEKKKNLVGRRRRHAQRTAPLDVVVDMCAAVFPRSGIKKKKKREQHTQTKEVIVSFWMTSIDHWKRGQEGEGEIECK